jgi:ABC-type lipoprotein release transport system permease subunit
MQPVIAGLFAGVALALGAGRVLQSLLFSVAATDLPTYTIVLFVVAASALAACVVPAARAASIDPATTLRSE